MIKRTLFLIVLLLCISVPCTEALAGLGKPVSSDSLKGEERNELIDKVKGSGFFKSAGNASSEEKINVVLERLPDADLKLLARNIETNDGKALAGGLAMTLGEAIGQLLLFTMIAGVLIILLLLLGVVALFAGGAAVSGTAGAPMGQAQYDAQKRKLEDSKRLNRPVESEK